MGKPKGIPRQTLVDTAKKAVNMKTHTWNCESRQGTVKSVRYFDDMDEPVKRLIQQLIDNCRGSIPSGVIYSNPISIAVVY